MMPAMVYTCWLESTILVNGALTPSLHSSLYEFTAEEPSSLPKSLPQVRVMVLELLLINFGFFILDGKFESVMAKVASWEGSVHPVFV